MKTRKILGTAILGAAFAACAAGTASAAPVDPAPATLPLGNSAPDLKVSKLGKSEFSLAGVSPTKTLKQLDGLKALGQLPLVGKLLGVTTQGTGAAGSLLPGGGGLLPGGSL
jgi:hypothetical protein